MIIRFIKTCCISNAKDGTDDDVFLKKDGDGPEQDSDYVYADITMKSKWLENSANNLNRK